MKPLALSLFVSFCVCSAVHATPPPANLVADGIPEIPEEIAREAGRYLEFRAASFQDWHPRKREMLITTRFAETAQLHEVKTPGGARKQLTFFREPVRGAKFRPGRGDMILFSQDTGGGEFYQLYRYDVEDGKVTLLTDGKSRNTGPVWSPDGSRFAWTSTRRNGKDNDIWIMDPDNLQPPRLVAELSGGGWSVTDWSPDGRKLAVLEYISANQSHLWLLDIASGQKERLTPDTEQPVSRSGARFSKDGKSLYFTSDEGGEFARLGRMSLADRKFVPLTASIPHDVSAFDLAPDGRKVAFVTNEAGRGVLYVGRCDESGSFQPVRNLPYGVIGGLRWHPVQEELAFTLTSANSPSDVYSLEARVAGNSIYIHERGPARWTESETGGLNAESFARPELVEVKSFDGLPVSGFFYRPNAQKFPGKRPVLVIIHGGPEGQSRPVFQARNNYYLEELGIALLYPNVRGSDGYGKTFLALDNGYKREDSVKDIGAFLDWIAQDAGCDAERVAVTGGSYGGYMTLASLIHHGDRLRCGIDVVGISNFVTFLKNTQDYRRDLRRVEYGDERDEKMREFLLSISPAEQAAKIKKPLFVVQGLNDPRVPVTEAEQIVKAVRANGGPVWYLMAKDEGHGFAKKPNADWQFLATIAFLKEYLLK